MNMTVESQQVQRWSCGAYLSRRKNALGAVLLLLVMIWGLACMPLVHAEESRGNEPRVSQEETAAEVKATAEPRKGKGATLFWIVLGVSFLFVIGSALSLNALGGKRQSPRQRKDDQDSGG